MVCDIKCNWYDCLLKNRNHDLNFQQEKREFVFSQEIKYTPCWHFVRKRTIDVHHMKCRVLRFGKKNRDTLKVKMHIYILVYVFIHICVFVYMCWCMCVCVICMDLYGFYKSVKFKLDIAVQIPFTLRLHYRILAPYCALNTYWNTNINYYNTQNANKTNFISNLSNAFRCQQSKVYKHFQFYAQKMCMCL